MFIWILNKTHTHFNLVFYHNNFPVYTKTLVLRLVKKMYI